MKHFSNINLNLNELQNAVIQNLNMVPITSSDGQIYYDTSINKLKLKTPSGWVIITSGGSGGPETLDQVLTNGNVSQINAFVGDIGIYNNHVPSGNGYVYITGSKNIFHFYNNIGTEYAQILQDAILLKDFGSIFFMQIKKPTSITAARTATFQDASGTVAYLSDIPTVSGYVPYTGATGDINIGAHNIYTQGNARLGDDGTVWGTSFQFAGLLGSLQSLASTNLAWLLPNQSGTIALLSNIPTVGTWGTLNYPTWVSGTPFVKMTAAGTFALDITTYYPYPTGTVSQYIDGTGAFQTFPTIPTITPAALTKTDDTNVTLTLGGTPATALLQATSITVGWTGTLADSRITSATNWNTAYTNRITSLTTTGSGAPSLVSNVLNIPNPASGTINYVSKFTGAISLGNSLIYDDGTNVGIGTTAPTAKLHIAAPGALSTDIALRVRNSADTGDLFQVQGNGAIVLSSGASFYTLGNNLNFRSNLGGGSGFVLDLQSFNSLNSTNNEQGFGMFSGTFAPTSGTGTLNGLKITPTINQTGGANGITRGLFINPTLTVAADFRAIETTVGNVILGSTSGNVGIGTAAPVASAKVQIDSTTQGFLPPRMTNAQRIAIATPAVGLCVYCTDVVEGLYINKSTGWTYIG
jgi:hypothetical protein